jgi:hypothetical protein
MKKVVLVGGSLTNNFKERANDRLRQSRVAWRRKRASLCQTRGNVPLDLDYAQTYGMGASGRLFYKLLPVDPPRMSRLSDSPENDADTDVQTRDCASLNRNGRLGRSQRRSDRICPKASGNLLRRDRRRRVNIGFSREKKQSCVWASRFGVDRDVYRALYCQA